MAARDTSARPRYAGREPDRRARLAFRYFGGQIVGAVAVQSAVRPASCSRVGRSAHSRQWSPKASRRHACRPHEPGTSRAGTSSDRPSACGQCRARSRSAPLL